MLGNPDIATEYNFTKLEDTRSCRSSSWQADTYRSADICWEPQQCKLTFDLHLLDAVSKLCLLLSATEVVWMLLTTLHLSARLGTLRRSINP